jgi:hypothetical protein
VQNELTSPNHDFEHISMHLTAHVLPALDLLNSKPSHSLSFAYRFLDLSYLQDWLDQRNWRKAWLEGNNLFFIGQFLIHLRDVENNSSAQAALDLYFKWLDQKVDPHSGLWGTDGFCSNAEALYGGYHQLILYYYENHPVKYTERLIDVALSLQHADGGFNPRGGGGACEDVDAIDILVNMYKIVDYKRPQIRYALRRALRNILKMQISDGGFVYRLGEPFIHMGIQKTKSGSNSSNLFSTWFRVHALALINEIITDDGSINYDWQFNNNCSMGWHKKWDKTQNQLTVSNKIQEIIPILQRSVFNKKWIYFHIKRILPKQIKHKLKRLLSHQLHS